MSLYLVGIDSLKGRKAKTLFLPKEGYWYALEAGEQTRFKKQELNDDVPALVGFALKEDRNEFEVCLDKGVEKGTFLALLRKLSTLLLDVDVSAGLLVQDRRFLKEHENEIKDLGLSVAYPTLPRPRPEPRSMAPGKMFASSYFSMCNASAFVAQDSVRPLELEESFHDRLLHRLISSGKSNAEVYRAGGISKQVFSKIISSPSMIPTKATVFCLIVGLKLTHKEAMDLLSSAGYAFSMSLAFDAVVERAVKEGNYDLDSINAELNAHGCPILGWHPRED